jgi:hypothetical protein
MDIVVTKTLQLHDAVHSPVGKRLLPMAALLLVCVCVWFTAMNVGIARAMRPLTS